MVLGTAQDGGLPQPGCRCDNCQAARSDPARAARVACLGILDGKGHGWLVDATPDFRTQVEELPELSGILLTHAHMGHVAGLLWLGKEAMAVRALPLWAGPRLLAHLAGNEPWASLFRDRHLAPETLRSGEPVELAPGLTATPVEVPHRGEWSETFAFRVSGRRRTVLWCPDIDELTAESLPRLLDGVDVAFLDGTFWDGGELPGRDLSEIPHPFIRDTLHLLIRGRIGQDVRFVHLNHTNPLWDPDAHQFAAMPGTTSTAAQGSRLSL